MRRAILLGLLVACDKSPAPTTEQPEPQPAAVVDEEPDPEAFELAPDAPTNKDECNDRVSYANAAIKRGQEQAAMGCRRDEDCIVVSLDTHCQGGCTGAISAEHEGKFKGLQAALDDKVCKGYEKKAGCPVATPRCIEGAATCNYGTCEFEMGAVDY
jgi:hypothetical protein